MRQALLVSCVALLAVACTSRDVGPYAPSAEDKSRQQVAAGKAMCIIENQARCDHLIENRLLFSQFFSPQAVGNMDESERFRGRSVTTKFVVEAVSAINQCQRTNAQSLKIIKGMEIAGKKFDVMGTSPLVQQTSKCFITPQLEAS